MKKFLITDVNKPLMSGYPEFVAKSGADAIRQYCKANYPNNKPKASGSNYVQLAVREGFYENGRPYFIGGKRQSWYELI